MSWFLLQLKIQLSNQVKITLKKTLIQVNIVKLNKSMSWSSKSVGYVSDNLVITAKSAKSLQSCSTLCDPIDGSPPGSPIPGILQARTLEWVAISFSNAWKWEVKVKSLSRIWLLATPWTAAYQVPLPMGFSRQEYWSGVPLPLAVIKTSTAMICSDVSLLMVCFGIWAQG